MTRERRRFPRAAQPFEARYRFAGQIGAPWNLANIMNLGAGGIRMRSEERLEIGALLDLELTLPSRQQPILLQGQVIWDHLEAADVIEHGIEFVAMTPTQQMQLDELVRFMRIGGSGPSAPT